MWKDVAKEYFRFSKRERAGILALLVLMVATCGAPELLFYFQRVPVPDTTAFRATVQAFEAQLTAPVALPLFNFDPNTLSVAGWQQLGVSARTAGTIQQYLLKGGRFRQPADLQRIYGLSPGLCERLLPFVQIADRKFPGDDRPFVRNYAHNTWNRHDSARNQWKDYKRDSSVRRYGPRKMTTGFLDINTADTLSWQALPGIGPGFARRLVAFRDKLGGFYAIAQVGECYGLADSTFQKIQPLLRIGDSSLKKLDLNLADEKSLAAHPYIRYKLARLIVQYRSAHAGFRRTNELLNLPLVDEIIYRKIEHYIEITF
ncbi:helix-hairpin-helix domain-containing protein [Chitinophaga sp. MM2321]|uniref:ComEA family DNA-binding protein n=1 Tax=Chitinophaga sp. MM2321 TaxID=3137178 RepID=UPI0032D5750D